MQKLTSNIALSNSLIEKAKNKARPEAKRRKESLIKIELKELKATGIPEEKALPILRNKYDNQTLDAYTIINLNDGRKILAGEIKVNTSKYSSEYVYDSFYPEDGGQKGMVMDTGDIYSFKHGGYIIKLLTTTSFVIDRIVAHDRILSESESNEFKSELEVIMSSIEDLAKNDIKKVAKLLKSKGVIKVLDDFDVKVKSRYELSKDERPLSTDKNLESLLKKYSFDYGYDEISKEISIKHSEISENTDNDLAIASSIVQSYSERDGFRKDLIEHLHPLIMNKTSYNPLKEMVEDAIQLYDGKDYIQLIAECLHTRNCSNAYKYHIIKIWLIQCVAAWFFDKQNSPVDGARMSFEQILTLQGSQGLKKTKFLSCLLNFDNYSKYFKDGAKINPSDKDTIVNAIKHGIVEIGELDATFRKSDIAELKAFMSNSYDLIRLPYDRAPSKYRRMTSFSATVNELSFLVDQTGNRRFLILPLTKIDFKEIESINFKMLWGQIGSLYKSGVKWWLDALDSKDQATLEELHRLHATHVKTTMIDDIVNDLITKIKELSSQNHIHAIPLSTFSPTRILQTYGIQKPGRNEIAEFKSKMELHSYEVNKAGTLRLPINLIANR